MPEKPSKPETFLILGASSFYGRNFAEYVRSKGDVAIEASLRKTIHAEAPTYIVNFAAENVVAESWERPADFCDVNISKLTSLVEVFRNAKLKRFIQVSTPEVYGDMEGWQAEHWHFNPSTPYAVSRAAADMMLRAYHRAYGFPAIITRTANVYGPGQQASRIIPLAFEHFRTDKKLDLDGNGQTRRAFIHVKDACRATYLIAKTGDAGQVYHISTDEAVTINDLCRRILKILNKPVSLLGSRPDRLGKDMNYLLNSQKLRNMGWRPDYGLDRGLEEYADG